MSTVVERCQTTRTGGGTSRLALAAPFRALRLVICGTALVGLITSAAAGTDPESDETITNEEFVREVLESGIENVQQSEFENRPQVLPLLGRALRERNRRELRPFLDVCSKMVLGTDHRAALVARAEMLALLYAPDRELSDAAMETLSPLLLSASEWVDEHSSEWTKAEREVGGRRVLFGQHDTVDFQDLDFASSKLTYLRIVNVVSPRKPGALETIENVGPDSLYCNSLPLRDADLKYLAGLSNFVLFELNETNITGSGLRDLDMPNLRFVHLYGCPVKDDTVGLIDIPTLELLDLQHTGITDMGLGAIRPGRICALWINGTRITTEGLSALARFEQLYELSVDGKLLSKLAIMHLAACRKLGRIRVQGPLAEGMTREKLVAALPECDIEIDDSTDSE